MPAERNNNTNRVEWTSVTLAAMSSPAVGLPRVLEYSRVLATREYSIDTKNYSGNFLLLEYSLNSTSGCQFPLPVSIFAN